jgi:hypothetical protein
MGYRRVPQSPCRAGRFTANGLGGQLLAGASHRELIRGGVTGTPFRAGDPAAFASALALLPADRYGWAARRDAARICVEKERIWSTNVSRYAPVYQTLTGNAGRAGTRL